MIAVAFLANDGHHLGFPDLPFLIGADITGIKEQLLALVVLCQQRSYYLTVMDFRRGCPVFLDKLAAGIGLDVSLVTIERLAAFLCPACINVLVALLVRLVIPQFIATAFFYRLVLIMSVALPGSNDKRCVYYLATGKFIPPVPQECDELVEEPVEQSGIRQDLTEFLDSLFIGDIAHVLNAEELLETGTVGYLVLYLMVAQTVIALEEQYLEHHHRFYRMTTGIAFLRRVDAHGFQFLTEHLKINFRGQFFKRIAHP